MEYGGIEWLMWINFNFIVINIICSLIVSNIKIHCCDSSLQFDTFLKDLVYISMNLVKASAKIFA